MLKTKLLKYAIFALVPSLLLLVFLELGFRGMEINYHPHDPGMQALFSEGCYRPSLTRGYEPIPGTCGRNSLGMYAKTKSLSKKEGVFRVLVIGDSIADQRLWVDSMEESLVQALPNKRIEVFNAGVVGYDTCSELKVFEENGLSADPDMVLLQFCLNDFTIAHSVAMPLGRGKTRLFLGKVYFDLPNILLKSRLGTWIAINYGMMQSKSDKSHSPEEDFAYTRQCLSTMKKRVENIDASFTTVVFPPLLSSKPSVQDQMTFQWGYKKGEKDIKRLLKQIEGEAIYLRPILEKEGKLEGFRHQPNDPWHPDVRGQQIIGNALSDILAPQVSGQD